MNKAWRTGEAGYCQLLVARGGDQNVSEQNVGEYLILQSQAALRDREFEISALLAISASYLRQPEPDWLSAQRMLEPFLLEPLE